MKNAIRHVLDVHVYGTDPRQNLSTPLFERNVLEIQDVLGSKGTNFSYHMHPAWLANRNSERKWYIPHDQEPFSVIGRCRQMAENGIHDRKG
jgi:hypothetical protein